jgi:hypothetical protein
MRSRIEASAGAASPFVHDGGAAKFSLTLKTAEGGAAYEAAAVARRIHVTNTRMLLTKRDDVTTKVLDVIKALNSPVART